MRFAMLFVLLSAGCLQQTVPPHSEAESVPEDSVVQAVLAKKDFRTADFVRVNWAPYPSALPSSEPTWVNVYVRAPFAPEYEVEDPNTSLMGMKISPGMFVVREVENAMGEILKLTVMVRHEDGWFPQGGDFLYGVTDLTGAPMDDPHSGSPQWGKLTTCGSCHQQRADEGWMFGVPNSVRPTP